jgi:hypothetical protein
MKVTRSDERSLIIVDFPYLVGAIWFIAALFAFGRAVFLFYHDKFNKDFVGALLSALMFSLGVYLSRRSIFNFDLVRNQLTWSRRGLFTRAGGVIPLAQIRSAVVQTINGDGILMYRVCLKTETGDLPLTIAYEAGKESSEQIRLDINNALKLNLSVDAQMENDIVELAIAGRKIDAISLACTRYGYGLAEAKSFVESLTQ